MAESSARKKQRQALMAELAIVMAVIVTTYVLSSTRIFRLVEQGTYDYRMIFRPRQETAQQIVYMNIDDASLLKFGRWPWPRSHHARIISTLKYFGAKNVFLDIEFPEESPKILKESISGQSFFHSLDIFEEGTLAGIENAKGVLLKQAQQVGIEAPLQGLHDYVGMQVGSLRRDLQNAVVNPDQVFVDELRRCGNIYSVFFVEEPSARVLLEAQARLKAIESYVKDHPDEPYDRLPGNLKDSLDARDLYNLVKLRMYLRNHIDAPTTLAASDLGLDPDYVSREIETARQYVLEEAIVREVREAAKASFEDVSAWVVKKLSIANPGNYEEFMKKFYTKASSQQIVKNRFSMPLFSSDVPLEMPSSDDFQPPISLFAHQFKGLGFSNVKPDNDGSIRSVPLFWRLGNRVVKHAAFRLVCDYLGVKDTDIELHPGPKVVLRTQQGPIAIPVDHEGQMLINWAGDFLTSFEHRSLDGVRDFLNLTEDYRFHLKQGDMSGKYAQYALHLDKVKELEVAAGELEYAAANPAAVDATVASTATAALGQVRAELEAAYKKRDEYEDEMFKGTLGAPGHKGTLEKVKELIAREKARPQPDQGKLSRLLATAESSEKEMREAQRYRVALNERKEQLGRIVKDRICMVGSVASGTVDLGVMPYQEVYPKVGVHANVINTVLTRHFIRRIDRLPSFLILITVALASGLLFPRVSILSGSILLVEMIAAYAVIAYVVLRNWGLWIDVAPQVCAIFLNYTCISVYRYVTELAQRRFVEKVFAHYLSQEVIDQLIEDPDRVRLGGEETEITPFFSDVAGFSTISEKLTPTELVNLLNEYLTEMTNILLKYQGTLDKYEGDAVIAFFGAPLHFNDHAAKACFASLEMQQAMVQMRERLKAEGRPLLKMRIGLNTGRAVVGNMGSQDRFNYTMMGDTVNLASRLEGANKPYGSYIMMSQWTQKAAQDQIESRELDRILVVGKLEPVTVYELLSRKGQLERAKQNIIEVYNQGLDLYRKREWMAACEKFMQADQFPGGDPPSREYIRRCQEFAAFPPPDDWDGTYQMKDKGK
ncbi:MAG: CHASE2 domain-containing protein [Candidatus Wallbacteria bacterium]|nr:CHASE2 domain-containing protein [Candidatus Wallbacteria bacterium]